MMSSNRSTEISAAVYVAGEVKAVVRTVSTPCLWIFDRWIYRAKSMDESGGEQG